MLSSAFPQAAGPSVMWFSLAPAAMKSPLLQAHAMKCFKILCASALEGEAVAQRA